MTHSRPATSLMRKFMQLTLLLIVLAIVFGASWVWLRHGTYGFHVLARRGGTYWISVGVDDPQLSPSMRLALTLPAPSATVGKLVWNEAEPGYEIGELPVLVDGQEVDRVLLNRISPARFRFVVHNAPDGDKNLEEWERALPKAVLIVNGSYYDLKGRPDTPFISEGVAMGPQDYEAKAGAFVANAEKASIIDLSSKDWHEAFADARNAMVSYPMLIGPDGQTHVPNKSRWLANRTFVGQDAEGRIVIGTTQDAFFPLDRLADFLKSAPLDLKLALNLDGGPIACQSVRLKGFKRSFHAKWEAQVSGSEVKLLQWPLSNATWAMPVVLTAERRD